jgi:hypothetical protein
VFSVRCELGFHIPEDGIFIVTAVETLDLTLKTVVGRGGGEQKNHESFEMNCRTALI